MKKMILSALLLSSLSAQAGIMKDLDMVCTSQQDARDKVYVSITPINGNNVMSIFTQIDGRDCNGNSVNIDSETLEAFTNSESASVQYSLTCHSFKLVNIPTELSTSEDSISIQTNNSEVMSYSCEKKGYFERLRESLTLEIGS